MIRLKSLAPALICLFAVVAAFFLYYPGFSGPLLFDDSHVLKSNKQLLISSLSLTQLVHAMESFVAGGRQISMLSFALNLHFFGDSSWWLKCINAIIHCLNGLLLFVIFRKIVFILTPERSVEQSNLSLLPAIATALWLVSPINLTSVLYVSQRMTLLSSFFVLSGIWAYMVARLSIKQPARRAFYIPLLIIGFTVLGYLCKENGALLPLFIAAVEVIVFRFKSDNRTDKVISCLFGAAAVVGVIGLIYVFYTSPSWLFGGFKFREFTLIERVMTQFRVLVFHISQILAPSTTTLSLWHDGFGISRGLLSPPSTLLSAAVLSAIGIAALGTYKKMPLMCLGIVWFFVAHSMESTILPLELVHEHRNYLASFGILFSLTCLVFKLTGSFPKSPWAKYLMLACMFGWSANVLSDRAQIWSDEYKLAEHGAVATPQSPFANFALARLQYHRYLDGDTTYGEKSKEYFLKVRNLQPDEVSAEMSLILASEHGAFDYDPQWLESIVEKFPQATLSVPLQNAIISYLECLHGKRCNNSEKDAYKIFDIFLESDNPYFLNFYALYYSKIDYQPQKAEPIFERSLSGKDITFWMHYFDYLIDKGKWDIFCKKYPELDRKILNFEFTNATIHIQAIRTMGKNITHCEI